MRPISGGPLALQTLIGDDIEAAFPSAETLIQLANKGADIKMIGSGARAPVNTLMVASGMDLPNLAKGYPAIMQDIEGKKIGVSARGAGSKYALNGSILLQ